MTDQNDKIIPDGDEITQALEDVMEKYAQPAATQTEKSNEQAKEEARALIASYPGRTNKEIAEETGLTPSTVAALRRFAGKGKTTQEKAEPKYKTIKLPTLIAIVKRITYMGRVAEFDVEDRMINIRIKDSRMDPMLPIDHLGEFIDELNALKTRIGEISDD